MIHIVILIEASRIKCLQIHKRNKKKEQPSNRWMICLPEVHRHFSLLTQDAMFDEPRLSPLSSLEDELIERCI